MSLQLAEEKISNIKTVKAFSKERAECQQYSQRIENLLKLAYKESLAVGSFYGMVCILSVAFHNYLSIFATVGFITLLQHIMFFFLITSVVLAKYRK